MAEATSPPHRKFFYGWFVVAAMALAGAVGTAMGGLNFGLFIKPMGDELGFGRAAFGWAQTARQVSGAVTSPIVGPLIDRFGVRVILPFAMFLTTLGLITLPYVLEPWHLVALFGFMGIVGMTGPGSLLTTVPVAKWFVVKRGRAMSFITLGVFAGGAFTPPLTQILIDTVGWRNTWTILGIVGACIVIPACLLLVRRQPEDIGLLPDGALALSTHGADGLPLVQATADEESWTLREAVHTLTFWRLVFVFSIVMLGMSMVGVHRMPHFMDRGIDPMLISYATSADATAAGISTAIFGSLLDRFPPRYLGAIGFVIIALGVYCTINTYTVPMVFVAMVTLGIGVGVSSLLQSYLWALYYGRANLGAIRGFTMPITLFFGGVGAPIAGYVRDISGSYDPAWWVGLGLFLIGAVAIGTSTAPVKKQPASA